MYEQKPVGRHPQKLKADLPGNRKLPLTQRDHIRAWVLIILGLVLVITGAALAIHQYTYLDVFPLICGIAMMIFGHRYLKRGRF